MTTRSSVIIIIALVTVCGIAVAAAQTVEVPFDFVHNQIVVKVTIDGKGPFNALIDTGTDPSAIDIGIAREVGIKVGSFPVRAPAAERMLT